VREAVGALFQLGLRYRYAGLRHDERRLIGSNFGMHTWIHRMSLSDDCCVELLQSIVFGGVRCCAPHLGQEGAALLALKKAGA
jgi:hypothetical protein